MKNVVNKIKNYPLYFGIFFLAFSFVSCSDDDDNIAVIDPTGSFDVEEEYTLTGNTVTIGDITVGQDSWLVAVNPEEEDTDNFISEPVWLDEGLNTDIMLTFDEDAISDDGTGQEVVLKLYADNGMTEEEWDADDEAINNNSGSLLTETITVFDATEPAAFADFDEDGNNLLDENEVANTYINDFEEWDADNDGFLDAEEFYSTSFYITDADDDDGIDVDEWDSGYGSLYGVYVDDDFATFDADADGVLDTTEWNDVFMDSQWFETYDADDDSLVADTEWDEGLFSDWDLDNDDFIDEDEYNTYVDYVSFW